ncbi:protein tyrosine phosphatase domain-containing protein 1 isoform X1 [Cyprinodon tularosa]|uniref:protein tyrosine phosphatase domain-containing protein 1 isoform X1 n=2 Tax=Cyprinodon tularosa TaxID=77115 RepID=UPI0018E28C86|nr:protein tyrosine phosphatase domain-containing protein 1 isoform X1 [Cyprinodon tularosa]
MAAGVGVLTERPHSVRATGEEEITADMEAASSRVPTAKYTKMGETLRHVIPGPMQCSMACGGRACKYENPSRWRDEEQVIKGLYSSWITDNLLAMARPSSETIEKYQLMQQFQRCGLTTVINLQRPGEHASCGYPLEQESGFTYRPEAFMEAGIYYYNFGWKDYGVASLTTILDMVKVMSFAVQEGKMAVHCHAGLGRTGVLLACYLVFTTRMTADQAILFVRAKRPNSIQTRGQLLCVREFAQFLLPLRSVFSCAEPKASAVTLSQYLTRQRHLLHGYEARQLKNVPKIVQLVCRLLVDIAANRQVVVEEEQLEIPDLTAEVEKTVSQQALQQLGQEMMGKGIPVRPGSPSTLSVPKSSQDQPLVSDNELDPLWRQQNLGSPQRSLSGRRTLSDSLLNGRGPDQDQADCLSKPISCLLRHWLSHSNLTTWDPSSCCSLSTLDRMGRTGADPAVGRCVSHKRHHSLSLLLSELGKQSYCDAAPPPVSLQSSLEATAGDAGGELSTENRRLAVAKALALDPTERPPEASARVSMWQVELNSREGAWERLCNETDPVVLCSLMWSWLEQLRDPVLSQQDVQNLRDNSVDPQSAISYLEKGRRMTLLCVLSCAARLLPLPDHLLLDLLTRTIRAFTKTDPALEQNKSLYGALRAVLTPFLYSLRDGAVEMTEDP